MSWTGCDETALWLTHALEDAAVCARVREEMGEGAPAASLVRAIARDLPEQVRSRVERELGELPAAAVLGILAAWQTADSAHKPFVFESVRPESPIDLARRRGVRLTVDIDEDGVHAGLSHIPTRHPTWSEGAS